MFEDYNIGHVHLCLHSLTDYSPFIPSAMIFPACYNLFSVQYEKVQILFKIKIFFCCYIMYYSVFVQFINTFIYVCFGDSYFRAL